VAVCQANGFTDAKKSDLQSKAAATLRQLFCDKSTVLSKMLQYFSCINTGYHI
jgi:hypothetical protein